MQVSPEEVETVLRDGIEYYIESALDPDFEESDADLYEPLPLDHVDENIGKLIMKHERAAEVSGVIPTLKNGHYVQDCILLLLSPASSRIH